MKSISMVLILFLAPLTLTARQGTPGVSPADTNLGARVAVLEAQNATLEAQVAALQETVDALAADLAARDATPVIIAPVGNWNRSRRSNPTAVPRSPSQPSAPTAPHSIRR